MTTCTAAPITAENQDTATGNDIIWLPLAESLPNCPMTGRQDCAGADSARCPAC